MNEAIREHIRRAVDAAPPMSAAQADQIKTLLNMAVKRRPDLPLNIFPRKAVAA